MSFTVEKKIIDGHGPRGPGVTLIHGETLKVVYNKYKTKKVIPKDAISFNLIFAHGTGMNKAVWHYHIKKLFDLSGDSFHLNSVISFDAATHGDSAVANKGKIGVVNQWTDNARDLNAILIHELQTTGDFKPGPYSRTVGIGHSYGGYGCLMASVYQPSLFDSLVAVEPVFFGTKEFGELFAKRVRKIGGLLMDEFDSDEDFHTYFEKFHFFQKFHPEVMKDFLADEKIVEKKDGEEVVAAKCDKYNQMTCYFGALISIPYSMVALRSILVPVLHVVGKQANWNPKEAVDYFRQTILPDLITPLDLEGEHLINAERPDAIVDTIAEHLRSRTKSVKEDHKINPELVLQGNKEKIKELQFEILMEGNLEDIYGYDLDYEYKSKL